jgi:N-acetylglucosamine malate deacetylase 1
VRVLAVGAHPDDLEILCAGTLVRYVCEGHEVVMCNATFGDRGSFVHSSEEIARIRGEEARAAAALAGAEWCTLGLHDGEVNAADPEQRRLVVELVRETRPDVVITHYPDDYMADHDEVSKLIVDMTFAATLPLLETGSPAHDVVPPVFFMDTLAGLGFAPTEFVDVSDVIDVKASMLEAHDSQLTWLREHDGVDVVEDMRTLARLRGMQCGVAYAEGFVPCLRWLRPRPHRLLP